MKEFSPSADVQGIHQCDNRLDMRGVQYLLALFQSLSGLMVNNVMLSRRSQI